MAAQAEEDIEPATGGDGHCWPSAAQEQLLAVALLDGAAGRTAWEELRRTFDIDRLDPASKMALPFLYRQLKALGVDDPLLGIFKGIHRYNWARNELLWRAVGPVLRRFSEHGFDVALLKGAALAATTYGDLGLRYMADIDILVPTAARRQGIDLLIESGFLPTGGLGADAVDSFVPGITPGYAFRDAEGHEIDLHWNVLHQSRQPDADGEFWAAMRVIEFRGISVRVLDPSDQLLHVLAHGLRWNGAPPFRWVVDAAMILAGWPGPSMTRLVDQARRRRLAVPVGRGLDYLRRRFRLPVPRDAIRALQRSGSLLQRWEADLEESDPGERSPSQEGAYAYLTQLRGRTPLGGRPGWRMHLAALVACRGLNRARQLPADLLLGKLWPPCLQGTQAATDIAEGSRLEITRDEFHRIVGRGWQMPEVHGTWSAARDAVIRLRPAARSGLPLALSFCGSVFVAERSLHQRLDLLVNGRQLARWRLSRARSALPRVRLALPASLAAAPMLEIRFRTGPIGSPKAAGVSADSRRLGFLLNWIGLAACPLLRRGHRLRLGDAETYLGEGWHEGGWKGARIEGSAKLVLRLEDEQPAALWLSGTLMTAEAPAGGRVAVLVNGRRRAIWRWPPGVGGLLRQWVSVPTHRLGQPPVLSIEFRSAPNSGGSVWLRDLAVEEGPPHDLVAMPRLAEGLPDAGGQSDTWQAAGGNGLAELLDEGWSGPEEWGIWGVGARHMLWIVPGGPQDSDILLEAEVQAPLHRALTTQTVDVLAGGVPLARWQFDTEHNRGIRTARVPAAAISPYRRSGLLIELRPASIASPHELDPSIADSRQLGLGLLRIRQRALA